MAKSCSVCTHPHTHAWSYDAGCDWHRCLGCGATFTLEMSLVLGTTAPFATLPAATITASLEHYRELRFAQALESGTGEP